jgi:transposase
MKTPYQPSATAANTLPLRLAPVLLRKSGLFVGIDLHRDILRIEVQTRSGHVLLNESLPTQKEGVREPLTLLAPRVDSVVCEATGFWYWFADLCRECGVSLVLANPRRLRMIADSVKKCDRLDAHWLCEFLRQGYLDQAHVPDPQLRDRRELLRAREAIKSSLQDMKRRVRSMLLQYNIRVTSKDAFCKKGMAELRAIPLRPFPRKTMDTFLCAIDHLQGQLAELDRESAAMTRSDHRAQALVSQVPGVGPILAAAICAEAMDVGRFGNDHKFAAFAGLVPRVRESAGKNSASGITKQGPRFLRWALVQAARLMVRFDPVVKKWYQRHRRRKGAGRAYVMVAHKLARYVFLLYARGLAYDASKLFPTKRRAA